ncbi:gamma-glutamyltransferase [Roseivivax sp. CAU 1761]
MSEALSHSMEIAKHVVETRHGVVAAQHRQAAEAGAEVLRAGGDAVDAAVACGFVVSVLEPWMSGPAGGGAAMHWRAGTGEAHALNFGMKAPAGLRVEDFALSGEGVADDLFPWARVVEDRNVRGARAVAVPAMVDGHAAAHKRWGRLPWAELLAPAVAQARRGMALDWYATLIVATAASDLARDDDAAAMFLGPDRLPRPYGWTAQAEARIDQSRMADSLDTLAREGAAALHGGDLGAALARDVRDKGGYLSRDDLARHGARFEPPLAVRARDALYHVMPGLTAGPTFAAAITALSADDLGDPRRAYPAYARALAAAYRDRLARMGAAGEVPETPGCTTHFSVVDRDGNMVAHTQTLLSLFGARIVSPETGFLLNNGIMWFDPEPGKPNSLGPDRACLMNVCPVLGEAQGRRFALGASGGRKILPAVTQIASFLGDLGLDLQGAFDQPRIDVSGGAAIVADDRLPAEVQEALGQVAPVTAVRRTLLPYPFACPAAVLQDGARRFGMTEVMTAWGDAVAE